MFFHAPRSSLNRVGAAVAFVVIVPSGFANVCDVCERSNSTSTGLPCARAETAADTSSGRDDTFAGLFASPKAGFTGAAAATGAPSTEKVIPTSAHNAHANHRHTARTRTPSRKKNIAPRPEGMKTPTGKNQTRKREADDAWAHPDELK